MSLGAPREFLERARAEAERYGADPWVFVRELVQNARDAGAGHVWIDVTEDEHVTVFRCVDDGEGMSFADARAYLFSLYSSSKPQARGRVGRFGVGFWSVLRFAPTTITIRSRPAGGAGWGIRMDGELRDVTEVEPLDRVGTEVVLERGAGDGATVRRVLDAARQSARFVSRRDDPATLLAIEVGGVRISEPMALPQPSAEYRDPPVHVVVGLGSAPRVELFSCGLRIRSAATLQDLLSPDAHTRRSRVFFPELPAGIAPQALLECGLLEVTLSRADVRDQRRLGKTIAIAERELGRLIARQLAVAGNGGWLARVVDQVRIAVRTSIPTRIAIGAAIGVAIAVVAASWLVPPVVVPDAGGVRDLASRYGGPRVDTEAPGPAHAGIGYRPAEATPHFAMLRLPDSANDGAPLSPPSPPATRPYVGARCDDGCLDVELTIGESARTLRLPVPTGHRVVADAVTLGGEPIAVLATPAEEPMIAADRPLTGVLRYRTAPAADPGLATAESLPVWLPLELRRDRARLRTQPPAERMASLTRWVRKRIRYDRTADVAAEHERQRIQGVGFVARSIAIGAGDCDIQNGVLAALARAFGLEARLAIGHVGEAGVAIPSLHAWVEYRADDGRFAVADASRPSGEPARVEPAPPPPTANVAVAAPEGGDPTTLALPEPAVPAPRPWVGPPVRTLLAPIGGAVALLALAIWIVLQRRGNGRRRLRLGDVSEIAALVRGALQHPEVFSRFPGLFHQRVVPTRGGATISLDDTRRLARTARLHAARGDGPLARAGGRSGRVVDLATPIGRAVADAVATIDLDEWEARLAHSGSTPLLEHCAALARGAGERFALRVTTAPGPAIAVLDLRPLRARTLFGGASHLVLVARSAPWLASAEHGEGRARPGAALAVLDRVVEALAITPRRRAALLRGAAVAWLREVGKP